MNFYLLLLVCFIISKNYQIYASSYNSVSLYVQNVQFLPVFTDKQLLKQSSGIAQKILTDSNNIDIIGFTETFEDEARNHLLDELKLKYPHQLNVFPQGEIPNGKITNSGLSLVSQFPIVKSEFKMFSKSSGFDALSAKGVLTSLIKINNSSYIVLALTHQQSGGTDEIYSSQLTECRDAIRKFIEKFLPIDAVKYTATIIMGDMNISYNNTVLYQEMLNTYSKNTTDFWVEKFGSNLTSNPGYTYPAVNPSTRIDYILQLNDIDEESCKFENAMFTDIQVNTYAMPENFSDHLGVQATINIGKNPSGKYVSLSNVSCNGTKIQLMKGDENSLASFNSFTFFLMMLCYCLIF